MSDEPKRVLVADVFADHDRRDRDEENRLEAAGLIERYGPPIELYREFSWQQIAKMEAGINRVVSRADGRREAALGRYMQETGCTRAEAEYAWSESLRKQRMGEQERLIRARQLSELAATKRTVTGPNGLGSELAPYRGRDGFLSGMLKGLRL